MKTITILCLSLLAGISHAEEDIPHRLPNAPVILSGQYVCYKIGVHEMYCRRCNVCKPSPLAVIPFADRKP
jgi:hypothetical protein